MAKLSGMKNAPATNGNKSGKGRSNNPPKTSSATITGSKGKSKNSAGALTF